MGHIKSRINVKNLLIFFLDDKDFIRRKFDISEFFVNFSPVFQVETYIFNFP